MIFFPFLLIFLSNKTKLYENIKKKKKIIFLYANKILYSIKYLFYA